MKLSPNWLRDFVDVPVDNHRLADDITSAGIAVEGISGDGDATVFEIEITPNRPDAMNHYGVARECSAIYDAPLKAIKPELPKPAAKDPPFQIEIETPELCPRFTARILRDVTIEASPAKIAERLNRIGHRSINNAVDATNYVLWEIGKPTHVFDLDLLEGGRIIVRHAHAGETLKTLDGVERKLTTDDLVVADARKPVGLAGTMGGYDTMITATTRNILIESAWWDPATVRYISKRHGLHTDASHRFERGADFQATLPSCNRVAELILASGGGEVGVLSDVIKRKLDQAPVVLRVSEVRRILGGNVPIHEITRILSRLGFETVPEPSRDSDDQLELKVSVPSWRLDIEREIDLIEEIARIYGYDKFANTLPAYVRAVRPAPHAAEEEKLRSSLLALGYNEAVSLSFISHAEAEQFAQLPVLELANPLSDEASVMRTSLVPGMLRMIAHNLNRGRNNVKLFEAGNVFEAKRADGNAATAAQSKRACIGATGSALSPSVLQPARPLTFYDLKGDMETLLDAFGRRSLTFDEQVSEYFHPGRSARAVMDGAVVAQFGELHPDIAAQRKLREPVFIAEFDLDRLYKHELRQPRFAELPRFPSADRDFSFIFKDGLALEKIQRSVEDLHVAQLRSFIPVEIFRGGSVPEGSFSMLLRATFQSTERTLRDDEIAQWTAEITKSLENLGGLQRL